MTDELKPCPFCGGEVVFKKSEMFGSEKSPSAIRCLRCNFFRAGFSDEEIVRRWNTRPLEDTLTAELAALKAKFDSLDQSGFSEFQRAEKAEAERDTLKAALDALANAGNYCIIDDNGTVYSDLDVDVYYTETANQGNFHHPADIARAALEKLEVKK